MSTTENWLDTINWGENGLIPVITQEVGSNTILMFAWMNREALATTQSSGIAVYWSRSRDRLWCKGEESGHTQKVHAIRMDCDNDVLILVVEQIGGIACHTGRHSCFYQKLLNGEHGPEWQVVDPILKDPKDIYK